MWLTMKNDETKSCIEWINSLKRSREPEPIEKFKKLLDSLNLPIPTCPIITVAGTNGKGSIIHTLESIYQETGLKVGAYTTPASLDFFDQFRYCGKLFPKVKILEKFQALRQQHADESLGYYPFKTLLAFSLLFSEPLDVLLLEVGLGGKYDVVNTLDPTLSIIGSISLDHCAQLGNTRECIAKEKAGIMRRKVPLIVADPSPPITLIQRSKELASPMYGINKEFHTFQKDESWSWESSNDRLLGLPIPKVRLENAAAALMAISLLQEQLPVSLKKIKNGLKQVPSFGRAEVIQTNITTLVDVAHNPEACYALACKVKKMKKPQQRVIAVFSALQDKPIQEMLTPLANLVDAWYIAPLNHPESIKIQTLRRTLCNLDQNATLHLFKTVSHAYQEARKNTRQCDLLIVFGSFQTVIDSDVFSNELKIKESFIV
jgi:dihydrofolate synthase/folylpolyglutamate synthase